jgi:hypothetical protein
MQVKRPAVIVETNDPLFRQKKIKVGFARGIRCHNTQHQPPKKSQGWQGNKRKESAQQGCKHVFITLIIVEMVRFMENTRKTGKRPSHKKTCEAVFFVDSRNELSLRQYEYKKRKATQRSDLQVLLSASGGPVFTEF